MADQPIHPDHMDLYYKGVYQLDLPLLPGGAPAPFSHPGATGSGQPQVFVRDMGYTIVLVLQVLFYVTRSSTRSMYGTVHTLIGYNPLTSIIDNFRRVAVGIPVGRADCLADHHKCDDVLGTPGL
jgi:hypothetical protein